MKWLDKANSLLCESGEEQEELEAKILKESKGRMDKTSNKSDVISDVDTAKEYISKGFEIVEDGTALEHKEGGYVKISKRVQNALNENLEEAKGGAKFKLVKGGRNAEFNALTKAKKLKKVKVDPELAKLVYDKFTKGNKWQTRTKEDVFLKSGKASLHGDKKRSTSGSDSRKVAIINNSVVAITDTKSTTNGDVSEWKIYEIVGFTPVLKESLDDDISNFTSETDWTVEPIVAVVKELMNMNLVSDKIMGAITKQLEVEEVTLNTELDISDITKAKAFAEKIKGEKGKFAEIIADMLSDVNWHTMAKKVRVLEESQVEFEELEEGSNGYDNLSLSDFKKKLEADGGHLLDTVKTSNGDTMVYYRLEGSSPSSSKTKVFTKGQLSESEEGDESTEDEPRVDETQSAQLAIVKSLLDRIEADNLEAFEKCFEDVKLEDGKFTCQGESFDNLEDCFDKCLEGESEEGGEPKESEGDEAPLDETTPLPNTAFNEGKEEEKKEDEENLEEGKQESEIVDITKNFRIIAKAIKATKLGTDKYCVEASELPEDTKGLKLETEDSILSVTSSKDGKVCFGK